MVASRSEPVEANRAGAVGVVVPFGDGLGPVFEAGFVDDFHARRHGRGLQDGGDAMARADRSSARRRGSWRRRSESRDAWRCRAAGGDRWTRLRAAADVVALRGDPPFVVAVADGAARGDGAVVVDAARGRCAAQRGAQRFGGFEDDERVDGAARAGADGGREGGAGVGVPAEPRQARAPWRRAARCGRPCIGGARVPRPSSAMSTIGVPVLELFEIGAARDLVGEVVPGTGRHRVLCDDLCALLRGHRQSPSSPLSVPAAQAYPRRPI